MKQVFLIGNHDVVIYNFRHEIIERLLQDGYKVGVVLPYGEKVELLKKEGCFFFETKVDRRGTSIWKDAKLFFTYYKLLRQEKPDIILTYTIKPNIYGSLAAGIQKIPCIVNITGLGSAVENKGIMQKITLFLYKKALKKVQCVFFQNESNMNFFLKKHICTGKYELLPGSGVNLERFPAKKYPESDVIEFAFVARVMKEKGIDQYLDMAKELHTKYPNTKFHVCGFCEQRYEGILKKLSESGTIEYHGMVSDMRKVYERVHCIIHPTYYPEGLSNVLLEASATARPIIATSRPGCKEVIDDGINGFLVKEKDSIDLCEKVEQFISLDWSEKERMGIAGRKKVEREFDRKIVVDKYMKEVERGD